MRFTTEAPDGLQQIGDLRHDAARRLLRRGQQEISLPKRSYDLLMALVRHAPGIVTTDQLLTEVWGEVVVGEETVKQRVSLLRQALDDNKDEPRYIESIRGVGYRLTADVRTVADHKSGNDASLRFRLVVAASVGVLALIAWLMLSRTVDVVDEQKSWSIAVLPFEDLSAAADQAYFSDGIHEEVITQLSKIDQFAVTSRTSVLPYRGAGKNLREIASELGVNLVVEGSVRHSGGRVRITVQLIDALADQHRWSENYDRPLSITDLFAIQSDVAEKIAGELQTELTGDEIAQLRQLPTDSFAAYENFLLGRYHVYRGNADDLRRSIEFFKIAIEADDEFAAAYAGLGQALTFVGTNYGWLPPDEAFSQAKKHVQTALRLQPDFAEAYSLLGDILTWYDWDWAAAEQAYLTASQNSTAGTLGYMILLSIQNRNAEALRLTEEIIAEYPRDQWVRSNAAWRFMAAGDVQRAIEEANIAIEIDATTGDAFAARGLARLAREFYEDAISDLEHNVKVQSRSPASLASLATGYAMAGQTERAVALLAEIEQIAKSRFVPPDEFARVHVALGNIDTAFELLQDALEARSRGMIFLHTNLSWDPIREDPRFHDLLQAMQLSANDAD